MEVHERKQAKMNLCEKKRQGEKKSRFDSSFSDSWESTTCANCAQECARVIRLIQDPMGGSAFDLRVHGTSGKEPIPSQANGNSWSFSIVPIVGLLVCEPRLELGFRHTTRRPLVLLDLFGRSVERCHLATVFLSPFVGKFSPLSVGVHGMSAQIWRCLPSDSYPNKATYSLALHLSETQFRRLGKRAYPSGVRRHSVFSTEPYSDQNSISGGYASRGDQSRIQRTSVHQSSEENITSLQLGQ